MLIDLDGTLYIGGSPIEGARTALERIERAGVPFRFVTNTTRMSRKEVSRGLEGMGFPSSQRLIFTPATAANAMLAGRSVRAFVAGELLGDLSGLDLSGERPEYVLVGDLGSGFTYELLNEAFRCLMDGAELVALQKNRYWQREDGLYLDAGAFVAALEYASGRDARVIGKPELDFFGAALLELGLQRNEAVMVGDDAEVDVAGAKAAGLKGVQVRTGKYQEGAESGADLVIESFAELPEALGIS